ncbi:MAG: HAMP domain-containing sensor histidine kinase [Candidatus Paceibacterota bacterium]
MKKIIEYWKLFEESVIVFANRFQNNLALKTRITFAAALFLICVTNVISIGLLSRYVSQATLEAIFTRWGTALVGDIPSPAFTVLELQAEIATVADHYWLIIGTINVAAVLILGVITSKVALEPTRAAISAQRNFIAHTAHELRTPLAVARTNIEVALLDPEHLSKAEAELTLRQSLTELDALAGIINNLVMLNTLTNLEPAEYHYHDLHEIVTESVRSFEEYIKNKKLNLTVESTPDLLVWSNRNALKQMVTNILGNAINFTPENGSITVRAYQLSDRYMRVVVSDTGIGIAKDELPFIFKPFYRSRAAQKRDSSGSGLGLAIVRELVRLHHGRINFESVIDKGTTISIDLPIIKRRAKFHLTSTRSESAHSISFNYSRDKRSEKF